MSTRAETYAAEVVSRSWLSGRLVRLVLGGPGLAGFASTGTPDEWVSLIVPGQFQARYYTVRAWDGAELVLDVVVHDHGLVTEWVSGDCVGRVVTVSAPTGSFTLPADAGWLLLVGDLTALPAIARILESVPAGLRAEARVETIDGEVPGYVDPRVSAGVTWTRPPAGRETATAELVTALDWPTGPGYLWMAGESAQMRAVRTHLMRVVRLPKHAYDVMGYWRTAAQSAVARVHPGQLWQQGRAAGLGDDQIWAAYDASAAEAGRG